MAIVRSVAGKILPKAISRLKKLHRGVGTVPFIQPLERPIYVAIAPGGLKVSAVRAFLNVLKTQFPASELPRLEPQRRIQPV